MPIYLTLQQPGMRVHDEIERIDSDWVVEAASVAAWVGAVVHILA